MSKVLDGPAITLGQMLAAKDARAQAQRDLLAAHPTSSVLSVTLRIPGPVKTGTALTTQFNALLAQLSGMYQPLVLDQQRLDSDCGNCAMLAVATDPRQLKQQMLDYEARQPFCRLVDLDVCYLDAGVEHQLSRKELNQPARPCLVCGGDAKACSRSRAHGIDAVVAVVDQIVKEGVAI